MQAADIEKAMHSKAVEWLIAKPGRDTSNVDIAWDGAKRDIPLADIPIQTHYLVPNHGLGNAIFPEFESGTAPFAIPGAFRLPQYARWIHYDDWLELNAQRMLHDLWMGPYPWAPAG